MKFASKAWAPWTQDSSHPWSRASVYHAKRLSTTSPISTHGCGLTTVNVWTIFPSSLGTFHPPARSVRPDRAKKNLTDTIGEVWRNTHPRRSLSREGVFVTAIEAGLLTRGSFYSPTPSQPQSGQWLALLAFVPAHSGAP